MAAEGALLQRAVLAAREPLYPAGGVLLFFLIWRAAGREAVAGAQALMTLGPSHEGSGWNWPWLSQLLGLKAPAQEAEQDHSPRGHPMQ